jgi:hypothetical protein
MSGEVDGELQLIPANVVALVRRLALVYGDNTPIFATEDEYGHKLDGAEMAAIYELIVGPKDPPAEAVWWRCPECSTWQIKTQLFVDEHLPEPPSGLAYGDSLS